MVLCTLRESVGADQQALIARQLKAWRKFGAAVVVLALACAMALLAPSNALAQTCTSPNNTTCTVSGTQNYDGLVFLNGSGSGNTGTFNIESGGAVVTHPYNIFRNGYNGGTGEVNIASGGTFNSLSIFENGYTSLSLTTTGTLNIASGGTFNNADKFYNGRGNGNSTGTVNIASGGTFLNDTTGLIEQKPASSFSNAGTFTNLGSVRGGTFTNEIGGLFNHYAGKTISNVGSVIFNNHGTFNIGYSNPSLATTALTGTYTQSSTGTLAIRADWAAGTSDKLAVTGNATLAGTVVVTPLNVASTGGLTTTFADIITTTGTLDATALTATNTAAVSYTLDKKAKAIDLIASVNFAGTAPGGLTPNQQNVGGALNTIFGGGTSLGFMPALMGLATNAQLGAALDQLAPSGAGAGQASTLQSASTFAGQLLSCRTIGEGDANAIIREGQCVWARGSVRHVSFDNGVRSYGADETAPFYSAGAQFNLGGPWRVGGGIGYEDSRLDTNAGSRTDTDRLHLGAVLKYNPGPLLLAATVTGGFGWSDNDRIVSFGSFNARATSDYDTNFISGRLTAAYLLAFQRFYLKPQVDVAYTHVSRDGYKEQGTGGIALAVAGSDDGVWSASPMLEVGTQLALAGGGVARPFLKGGMTWRDTDSFVTSASFLDAPGFAPFAVTSRIDRVTADIAAGIDLITPFDTTLRLQYDGQFGNTVEQHIGSAKLAVRF